MKKILLIAIALIPLFLYAQNPHRDTTFGVNGNVVTQVGPNNEGATSIVVQSDGKIIAGGTQTDHPIFGPERFALVRYLNNGDLDSTFGINGIVKSEFLSQNWCYSVKLQPDEKIIAAGQAGTGICIARYMNNGSIDSSFGTNGFTSIIDTGISASAISDIQLLPGGKIISAGTGTIGFTSDQRLLLSRFNNNGSIDSSFGINGFANPATIFTTLSVRKIITNDNNKIFISGSCEFDTGTGTIDQFYLMCFDSLGNPDSSFGINGIVTNQYALTLNDMSFDDSGNIIAVGEVATNQQGTFGDVVVMKFFTDGNPDLTFGTNGVTRISVDSYADYAYAMLIDADGGIVLGGSYFNFSGGTGTDCMLIRFRPDGIIDSTFGTNGVFKTGVCSGTDMIEDIAFTSDKKIVVSGSANYGLNYDFIVGRIIEDVTTSIAVPSTNIYPVIYPNPANEELNFSTGDQLPINRVEVFDITGKLLISKNLFETGYSKLNISVLTGGIYFIKFYNVNGNSTLKFMKHE
jgi:uncharacterized delta-60 repeat protein